MLDILWLKVGGLWPVDRGGRRRSFEILRHLAEQHRVTVITTHANEEEAEGLPAALERCRVQSLPHEIPKTGSAGFMKALLRSWASPLPVDLWRCASPAMRAAVDEQLKNGKHDVCVVDFLHAAPNIPASRHGVPLVMFEHNVEYRIWQRLGEIESRPWRRAPLALEWRKMRRYEARIVAEMEGTIAVSDTDRAQLAALAPGAHVSVIPSGVDSTYFAPDGRATRPASLVFVGAMDWYPNEDAMLHFVSSVLPLVQREIPETTLTIVGRNPSVRVRALASNDVRVTGTVEDVRPYLAEASAVVVPLRIGSGTRLKILEALAMAKPLVSTTIGAEGLEPSLNEHFICADEPAAFAHEVIGLLRDAKRREQIGAGARRWVEAEHGWSAVAGTFAKRLEEVIYARERVWPGVRGERDRGFVGA